MDALTAAAAAYQEALYSTPRRAAVDHKETIDSHDTACSFEEDASYADDDEMNHSPEESEWIARGTPHRVAPSPDSERCARSAFARNFLEFQERQRQQSLSTPTQYPRPSTARGHRTFRDESPLPRRPSSALASCRAPTFADSVASTTSPAPAKKGLWKRFKGFFQRGKKYRIKEMERLRKEGKPIPSELFVPDDRFMGAPLPRRQATPPPRTPAPAPLTPRQRFPLRTPPSQYFNQGGRPRYE